MSAGKYVFVVTVCGLLPLAGAYAADLTTFANGNVEARYTTSLGNDFGDTIGNGGQGLYDIAVHRGNGEPWWRMNDGNPLSNVNTFGAGDAEDYFGYQFKLPASVTEINYSNRIYGDGGTFLNAPRVEVLRNGPVKKGGVWEEIPVSWNTSYDGSFMDGHRQYTISPTAATGDVWGVRLIGAPAPGPTAEPTGFIGVGELQVSGNLAIASQINLHNNLALNQTAVWSHNQYARPQILTDGNFAWPDNFDTTWGAGGPQDDYIGVLMSAAHNDVAAVGVSLKTFGDGGWFALNTMKVQYTTDGGTTWTDVTGLDMGRYPDDLDYLINVANWAEVAPFLWTFDPVDGVNGIRIIGPPGGTTDIDGFVGAVELEVFGLVPEPATVALLALGGLALSRRRR